MEKQFVTFFPGVYTDREKPALEAFLAECRAIEKRGPIAPADIAAGRVTEELPGVYTQQITEEILRYNNKKYDPDNPIYNDEAYARALGFDGLPGLPMMVGHDDTFMAPFPREARDYMLVSGLNHEVKCYKPIYAGDTAWFIVDERHLTDLTPLEGSEFRSVAIETDGSIYNQKGELLNKVTFRVVENLKALTDPEHMKDPGEMDWIGPDWASREEHYYSDADWDKIIGIWKAEKRQGAEPLYWEDVEIGFMPAETLDGPIDDSIEPTYRLGMGNGGTRTLRHEILDEDFRKTMPRSEKSGIYRMPQRTDGWPEAPKMALKYGEEYGGGLRSVDLPHGEESNRFMLINFMGRDVALRHIHNFMGDHGRLVSIQWGIMSPASLASRGYTVPKSENAVDFLSVVPFKAAEPITEHGMERDVMWVKSYVYDKYCADGKHYIRLAWWVDTILGETYESGRATIELPSRNGDL